MNSYRNLGISQLYRPARIAAGDVNVMGVAGATGDAVRGAVLFGATEALREMIQSPVAPVSRREYDRDVARIRAQLTPDKFAEAWASGRRLSLEQAVERALELAADK